MIRLLIPKIAKWSWCRCRLVSLHDFHSGLLLAIWVGRCYLGFMLVFYFSIARLLIAKIAKWVAALFPFIWFPSWFPFWAALGYRCRLVPSFVPLHDLRSGHLAAVALSPFICLPSWSPFWTALGCRCHLISLHLPYFVSLHDLHSGLLLAAAAPCLPLQSLSFVSQLVRKCYMGSMPVYFDYFPNSWKLQVSKTALLIPKLAKWSWCRCRLVSLHLFPFMISILGCSWLPLPPCLASFVPFMISIFGCRCCPVSLRLSPFVISILALSPPHSGLLLAAAAALSLFIDFPSWSPFWAALGCRCRLAQACLPSWFLFWAALGCRCRPSLSLFMISFLRLLSQASWFSFWAALGCRCVCQASRPSWFPFWAALGCRCRLVCLHLSPFVISILPLPPCRPSLSPFMISILGCSWLPLCLRSLSPFMISIVVCCWAPLLSCLSSHLSPFMISILGCSWLLPSCLPSLSQKAIGVLFSKDWVGDFKNSSAAT